MATNTNGYLVPIVDLSNSVAHASALAGLAGISTATALAAGGDGNGFSYTGGAGGTSGAGGVGGAGGSVNLIGGAGGATNGHGGVIRLKGGVGSGTGANGAVVKTIPTMTATSIDVAANGTATVKQLLNGYMTVGTGAGAGYSVTTPTGAEISAALEGAQVGDSFQVYLNNTVAQIMTWTAGASGVTVVGTATLAASQPSMAVFICTAANTWITYLIKNT